MPFIILQTSDNEKFFVDVEIAKNFGTIRNLLSCYGIESDEGNIIPLANVEADTLRKVLEWTDQHKNDPILIDQPDNDEYPFIELTAWDQQFLSVEKDVLFKLLVAANYLNIPGLMLISSKMIADMIRGKTPQEIRETFNIENDLTSEEEDKILEENDWL